MAKKTTWRNRIIGHGDEPLDQIMFNPANWRIHPKAQQDALEGVLSEVGWVQDVIVNKRTGNLIDGHLRCQVAARNNEPTVPVVYVDLTPDEEAVILASLDPLAAMAATDKAKLEELLHEVSASDARVQQMMADIAAGEALFDNPATPLDETALEGWGEKATRVIIVFTDSGQEDEFWERIGAKPKPGTVLYRWDNLVNGG